MGTLSRRQVLKGAAGAGALMLANPSRGFPATSLGPDGASRRSRLFPNSKRFVVHADLHNHSVISGDAVGDPDTAYQNLRAAGLDAASLTEHAIMGKTHGQYSCHSGPCRQVTGMDDKDWERLRRLADAANRDGKFTAIRGFEWTTGTMGHVNVWFGSEWIDGLQARALVTPRGASELDQLFDVPPELTNLFKHLPETATMDGFYNWLDASPRRAVLPGGRDSLAGFNHPNEYGNFDGFAYDARVVDRLVTCEALNMGRDFFFFGTDEGKPHPLAACLDAGWRTGFIGVSDNHGEEYGVLGDRGGLWVKELTRAGVREALMARRVFATRIPGLRLDAAAKGVPMGGTVAHRRGPLTVEVDFDGGAAWAGKPVTIQVIRPGRPAPTLAKVVKTFVPRPDRPPIRFTVDVDIAQGQWMFLRITDPTNEPDGPMPAKYAAGGRVIGYTSPFFFTPPARSD
ncbi:MAG: hypothetical protein QOG53_3419 [Frankiales bacterium]|jgi:hypothetical protein|nr:hypothetical protein [Frankiales bacterium]